MFEGFFLDALVHVIASKLVAFLSQKFYSPICLLGGRSLNIFVSEFCSFCVKLLEIGETGFFYTKKHNQPTWQHTPPAMLSQNLVISKA